MKRRAPARLGSIGLGFFAASHLVLGAACSEHVDVGFSRDATVSPHADAGGSGPGTDAGVARTGPTTDRLSWSSARRVHDHR